MLTNYAMEGHVLLAPDDGADMAGCPVNYGTEGGGSAPETGNAVTQAENNGAVGTEGAEAAKGSTETEAVQTPAWMAQLPKELRDDPELAKHRTMGDAIKYLQAEASKGKDEQSVADQDNQAQEGKAETVPVKYENFAKKLSDSNDPFGNITEGLVGTLENLGIPQTQAETIVENLDKAQADGYGKLVEQGSKYTETVMKKRWGKDYETNRRLMARGYQALGDSDGSLQKALDREGASVAPAVWEMLARVGKLTGEDSASGSRAGQTRPRDPDLPVTYTY